MSASLTTVPLPTSLTAEHSQTITDLVLGGDLSKMDNTARVRYYVQLCESLRLNPLTQPFQILKLSGKEVLYATKACTEQLRKMWGVSVIKLEHQDKGDVYLVVATVQDGAGRTDVATGAVQVINLKGEALANAYMKAETKAKRRATLSLCGLGMMDETEIETVPNAQQVSLPQAPEIGTSASVMEEPPAKPAVSEAGATASTSPAPSATSGPSDEAVVAGHRTRLLYARTIAEVQQIWSEIPSRLKPELVPDKDAAKARLSKASKPAAPAPAGELVAEFVQQPTIGEGPDASDVQRAELVRLTNLPVITAKEKADLLLVLRKLDEVRAGQAIFKLLNEIAKREGRDADKEMRQALHRFVGNYAEQLGSSEVDRLTVLVEDKSQHWQTLRAELITAKAGLQAVAA